MTLVTVPSTQPIQTTHRTNRTLAHLHTDRHPPPYHVQVRGGGEQRDIGLVQGLTVPVV